VLQLHGDAHETPQNSMDHFQLSDGEEIQKSILSFILPLF
jgi:hypothetical protein